MQKGRAKTEVAFFFCGCCCCCWCFFFFFNVCLFGVGVVGVCVCVCVCVFFLVLSFRFECTYMGLFFFFVRYCVGRKRGVGGGGDGMAPSPSSISSQVPPPPFFTDAMAGLAMVSTRQCMPKREASEYQGGVGRGGEGGCLEVNGYEFCCFFVVCPRKTKKDTQRVPWSHTCGLLSVDSSVGVVVVGGCEDVEVRLCRVVGGFFFRLYRCVEQWGGNCRGKGAETGGSFLDFRAEGRGGGLWWWWWRCTSCCCCGFSYLMLMRRRWEK